MFRMERSREGHDVQEKHLIIQLSFEAGYSVFDVLYDIVGFLFFKSNNAVNYSDTTLNKI